MESDIPIDGSNFDFKSIFNSKLLSTATSVLYLIIYD